MNDAVIRTLLKTIKALIPADQMKEVLMGIVMNIFDFNKDLPVDTEAGEEEKGILLYKTDEIPHKAIVFFDAEQRITRIEDIQTAEQIVDNLLKQF